MFLFVSRRASGILSQQFYSKLFSQPTHYLIAITVLSILNFAYQLNYNSWSIVFDANLWNPTWLLMGPVLLLFRYSREEKENGFSGAIFHLFPFLIMMMLFVVANLQNLISQAFVYDFTDLYQKTFILVPISLFGYGLVACIPLRKKATELVSFDDLQLIISGFYILIAAVSLLMYICWGFLKVDMVIDYRIIIYALLLSMIAVIFYHLSILKRLPQSTVIDPVEDESTLVLSSKQIGDYESKLKNYLIGEQKFLNPNLSLAMLSDKLEIPKYHLSVLFNHHLGKSFYSYLAALRIDYALLELEKENNYTVESLAYKCGFNSKTSFHKYFRDYTGLTPIAYINQKSKLA